MFSNMKEQFEYESKLYKYERVQGENKNKFILFSRMDYLKSNHVITFIRYGNDFVGIADRTDKKIYIYDNRDAVIKEISSLTKLKFLDDYIVQIRQ